MAKKSRNPSSALNWWNSKRRAWNAQQKNQLCLLHISIFIIYIFFDYYKKNNFLEGSFTQKELFNSSSRHTKSFEWQLERACLKLFRYWKTILAHTKISHRKKGSKNLIFLKKGLLHKRRFPQNHFFTVNLLLFKVILDFILVFCSILFGEIF